MAVSLRKTYATAAVLAELDAIAHGSAAATHAARAGNFGTARRLARTTRSRVMTLVTFAHPAVGRAAYAVAASRTR